MSLAAQSCSRLKNTNNMAFQHLPFILRRFGRQRLTTFLHVIGLTLGITVCLLIGLFIRFELSFDSYHQKSDRTYRVNQVWVDDGNKQFHYSTPFPLADQIRKDISGLENVTHVHHPPPDRVIEINPTKRFKQDHVMMTDPEFLDVFDVKVIDGNAHEALRKPYQALLTATTAKKFFGNEDPVGKVFLYNDKYNITVGGVIEDFPGNFHLPASMILSFADDEWYLGVRKNHYGSVAGGSTFIVLPKGMHASGALKAGLQGIYNRVVNNQSWMRKNSHNELEIQPLSDIHFNSKYAGGGEWVKAVNTSWLWFFGSVGIAVLILACINFINLSTAQALTRAKEVGVRKTIGAGKIQLIGQFLTEALVLVFVAAVLGTIIAKLALPSVNALAGKQITFFILQSPGLMLSLLVGVLLTALLAGLYPAWVITKFRPASILKSGSANSNPYAAFFRKGLVVTQFTISVCLLIAVMLIGKQMNFMRHRDLGFDKDNVITMNLPGDENSQLKRDLLKRELSTLPQVKGIAYSTSPPSGGENTHWSTLMSPVGLSDPGRQRVTTIYADDEYCSLYNLKLIAGRFFTAQDSSSVSESLPEGQRFSKSVVNEKLIQALGFNSPAAALGKRFWTGMNGWWAEIVGVVQDFNVGSLREAIQPTLIAYFPVVAEKASVKIAAGADIPSAIAGINAGFKKAYPSGIFDFSFLDQQLDALYKSEMRLFSLFKIFSALAILISCLGLWGLITFAAQQRVKEIGIRKVLGASVPNIVAMLTKDFIILVGIAIVIAAPLTWWGIHKWLQDFAFRIDIGWTVFVIAGIAATSIALITVSFQAIKAAVANPVKSLRSE
jgi:putative ABC transport system permease protein